MPICEVHGRQTDTQGLCEHCWADIEIHESEADRHHEDFVGYSGDSYLVDGLIADGQTREEAERDVKDPTNLAIYLELAPQFLLKDAIARQELINALLSKEPQVLWALYHFAKANRPVRKRGPKVNPKTRKSKKRQALDLRAEGYSLGDISKAIYGDKLHRKHVAAALNNAAKLDRPSNK